MAPPRKSPPAQRRYLSAEAAAAYLGVSIQTVYRYIDAGDLPAYRLAGKRLIKVSETDLDGLMVRIPAVGQ